VAPSHNVEVENTVKFAGFSSLIGDSDIWYTMTMGLFLRAQILP